MSDEAPAPDLATRVLAALEPDRTHSPAAHALRLVLVTLAALLFLAALGPLLFGDAADLPVHGARHEGAVAVALAVGFVYTAARPRRAGALLPVVATLAVLLTATTVVDVVQGRAELLAESPHVVQLAALFTMWALVRLERPRAPRRRRLRPVGAPRR
ncbi:MAG: hypothetical protein KatS3mg009_0403 [Acidimicrobiia bacterium]|nr:MAG: hypothetical protein KatS3mg009_0403 [Acidimicrobiia bacterium]